VFILVTSGERTSFHLYLEWPSGGTLRNSKNKVGKGARYKGAVAPPSLHPSDLRYDWAPGELEIAEVPGWLSEKASQSSDALIASGELSLFFKGARTAGLIRLAGKWRRLGADSSAILDRLRIQNAQGADRR
jgi:Bifunctional DNA primase/polymerase, N-terminal